VLSPAGNVRWRTGLSRPVIALETDPLGRFLVYGQATGEIVRLDLHGAGRSAAAAAAAGAAPRASTGPVRRPDWSVEVVPTDDQAETAVLAVLDDPPRVALFARSNRLQIFTVAGRNLGFAPEILGVGRIVRTAPGWVAAATDRQAVLFNARKGLAQRLDLSLAELTHLAIRPDTFGLALVQERDRLGRATPAGRWIWKRELKTPVEDLAIGPEGFAAITDDAGRLHIFDPAGEPIGGFAVDRAEPLGLLEAPDGAPETVVWLTLARRTQVLRGHDRAGRVVWEVPIPWEGWQFHHLGPLVVVAAPDGRALAFDRAGRPHGQGRATEGSRDDFVADPRGEAWRLSRQGVHLICADLAGRIQWRAVADQPLGPLAAGQAGVAVMIGRALAWFHLSRQAEP
jgi:hypothetical protein